MRTHKNQFLVGAGVMCAVFLYASAPAIDAQNKDQSQGRAAKPERVYSESPAAWFEAASSSAQISSDGKWALYPSFGHGPKLINLETGREEAERFTVGMDRVFSATFYMGDQLARRGERAGQQGWFLPGPDGPRLFPLPPDAIPRWSPDGSAVAFCLPMQADKGLFLGDAQRQKQYSVEGSISSLRYLWDSNLTWFI